MDNKWKELRKFYLSRAPTEKIFDHLDNIIDNQDYSNDAQILIYSNTFDCEIAREYPLPQKYNLKFLKQLIDRIESSYNVVNESIYNDYIELLNTSPDDFHYVTYTVCGQEFTFKQSDKMVSQGTTGLRSWEASFQLFEQIYANKELFKNKKILELGSGCGLTGILISSLCQITSYTFTDNHQKVIELMKDNLRINGFNLNKNLDKKLNKFYQYEDDDGNTSAKYYEDDDENDKDLSGSLNTCSFSSFNSNFVRSGPMNLESHMSKNKNDFAFDKYYSEEKSNVLNYLDNFSVTSKQDNDFFKVDINEKFKKFDERIENLKNERINFEEFLKSFEEKLSLLDENVNKIKKREKVNRSSLKNRGKDVNITELDWHWSNKEIIDKLNKYKPHYVIGSDIIFDPSVISELIRIFRLCLSNFDCGLIIVCSIRNENTIKEFEQQLRKFQEKSVIIQRSKISKKLSFFENVDLNNIKFVLYNIRNEDDESEG